METHSLAEGPGKRSDSQSEQYAADEVNKYRVGMKCDTEHEAQEISEVASNNKDYCEKQKNDGKGESEVRRNKIPQDTALARRHSIDCHDIIQKPETSAYSGKRSRKLSCSSILGESDELGEMFSSKQRRKIQKTCHVSSEQNSCNQRSNQQKENQIISVEDEEMECGDTDFINESEDTGSIDENTDPKDESEDTDPKDESEDTDPKDESEDTDPKDESGDTEPKDEKSTEEKQQKFWKDIRDSKLEALNTLLDEYDSNKEELNENFLPVRDILDESLFKVKYCGFEERFFYLIEKARVILNYIINEYIKFQPDLEVKFLRPKVLLHYFILDSLEFALLHLNWQCNKVLLMYEITFDNIPLPVFTLECMYSFINTARDIVLAFSCDVKDILDDLS